MNSRQWLTVARSCAGMCLFVIFTALIFTALAAFGSTNAQLKPCAGFIAKAPVAALTVLRPNELNCRICAARCVTGAEISTPSE